MYIHVHVYNIHVHVHVFDIEHYCDLLQSVFSIWRQTCVVRRRPSRVYSKSWPSRNWHRLPPPIPTAISWGWGLEVKGHRCRGYQRVGRKCQLWSLKLLWRKVNVYAGNVHVYTCIIHVRTMYMYNTCTYNVHVY